MLKNLIDKVGAWICLHFHDNITWPVNGHYTCLDCYREHRCIR